MNSLEGFNNEPSRASDAMYQNMGREPFGYALKVIIASFSDLRGLVWLIAAFNQCSKRDRKASLNPKMLTQLPILIAYRNTSPAEFNISKNPFYKVVMQGIQN